MSMDEATTPPQYIVTTPSEAGDVEEDLSQHDNVGGNSTKMGYPRAYSLTTNPSVSVTSSSTATAAVAAMSSNRIITQSTRSQSLQSSSTSSSTVVEQHQTSTCSSSSSTLSHQLKAKSSASIVTEQRSMMQKTSSISSASGKSKFQSFLQQPENTHPSSMGGGGFLTAHQKHVRQFVRSTSAHSEATASAASSRPEKCIRSASTQIEEPTDNLDTLSPINSQKFGLNQSSSILISKSAETIEMHKTVSASSIRTQLTLSGGLLAPPNRKITILSPIHAPPGLHDMLKRHGRSPLSPRISFPGSETDLFG